MKRKRLFTISLVCAAVLFNSVCLTGASASDVYNADEDSCQGVYFYDVETGEETYEEISIDVETAYETTVDSTGDGVIMESPGLTVEYDEDSLANETIVDEDELIAEEIYSGSELVGTDSIYEDDNRTTIKRPDLQGRFRNTCYLRIVHNDGSTALGTGFILNNNYVVTAGHCVYKEDCGGWNKSVTVYPAKYGSTNPYSYAVSTGFICGTAWKESGTVDQDWGVIKINSTFADQCGYLGLRYQSASYVDEFVSIGGYDSSYMKYHGNYVTNNTSSLVYYQKLDTDNGQSGSPVVKYYNSTGYTAIAIHRGQKNGVNCGVRLSQWLFNYLIDLKS